MDASSRHAAVWAITLVVGLLVTALGSVALASQDHERRMIEVEARTREAGERVNAALRESIDAAVAVASILAVDPETTPTRFRRQVVDGGLLRAYDDVTALSFARWVPAGELADREARLRARTGRPVGIHPPPGPGEAAVVVELVEPLTGNEAAIGFDLLSEGRRREAVERARDRGIPSVSAPIRLVQDDATASPSILLLVPVYRDSQAQLTGPARRRAFLGVATTVLRVDGMLGGLLPRRSTIDLVVEDVGPVEDPGRGDSSLLWRTGALESSDAVTVDLNVGDRRWRLTGAPNASFPDPLPAWLVAAVAGVALTFLTALLLYRQRSARGRAEALVEARTAELQVAVEQLQEADRAKSSFLSTVSHELRTPMTAVMGFVSLLRDRPDVLGDDRRRDVVERIDRNIRVLHVMIEELLAYSQADRQPTDPTEAIDLGASVDAALDAMEPLLGTLVVRRVLPRGAPVLIAPEEVDRVVGNLAINAVKYAGDGARVEVTLHRTTEAVELVVADDGPGIQAGVRDRVFERFERGSHSTTRGTGIGLAVVRDIARRRGGDVVLDEGTTGASVRVRLPLATAEAVAEPAT